MSLSAQTDSTHRYQSPTLQITALSPTTFVHVNYLEVEGYGKVACNGMLYVNAGEALVVDTPGDSATSVELLAYIETELGATVTGVVATHFHDDCLGGLQAFHPRGIPSFAYLPTLALTEAAGKPVPDHGFDSLLVFRVGDRQVELWHPGAGHTTDNIVCYLPEEGILFGGCLVKAMEATKGNLNDADVAAWPQTVARLRGRYTQVQRVIPGHGPVGGVELLEYTVGLFGG